MGCCKVYLLTAPRENLTDIEKQLNTIWKDGKVNSRRWTDIRAEITDLVEKEKRRAYPHGTTVKANEIREVLGFEKAGIVW